MPINNGSGSFNVGRDCQVVLIGPFGRIDLPNVMSFDCKQDTAPIKIDRLDGVQLMAELPKGWSGSFEVERSGAAIDEAFAAIEAAWFTTGAVAPSTIYQYISEPDGAQRTYQFDNATLKLGDAGTWKGDASVKQKIEFMANRRRSV